jgi:[acyl-carrier-protein] S-malonyltransferase
MAEQIKAYPVTAEIFSVISRIAGRDVLRLALEGPEDALREPLAAQLSVFGTSVCYWHLLRERFDFHGLAGHSLGFYSALYAASSLSLEDCVRIIVKADEAIRDTTKGEEGLMASIIGLRVNETEDICRDAGDVFVSNINSATQIVVSGVRDDVQKACQKALAAGALHCKELPIPFPLHSPLMNGIRERLEPFVKNLEIKAPAIPVISHIDSRQLDQRDIAEVICGQLTRRVMWKDTVTFFAAAGTTRFLEIGPSDVLSKLVRWIARDAESLNAGEVLDCQTV